MVQREVEIKKRNAFGAPVKECAVERLSANGVRMTKTLLWTGQTIEPSRKTKVQTCVFQQFSNFWRAQKLQKHLKTINN
jgi:hypothetical protein